MGGVAVYIGAAVLVAVGGAFARWPAAVAGVLTSDEDGNRLPATPGDVRRARLAGLALIGFGAVLAWYGPDAFRGPPDVGAP
jgi:hypothetical protein